MNNIIQFKDKTLTTTQFNGNLALSSKELAKGLGYSGERAVQNLYNRNKDEFTKDMTCVLNLSTEAGSRATRVFSPRGCHLIAMFSRTPFAKDFRKWVLDVLENYQKDPVDFEKVLTTPVRQHTRKLPTVRVKKEINLAESSIKAVSVIVANTVLKRLKEKEMQPDMFAEESKTEIARYCNEFHHRAESVIIMDTNLMEPTLEKGDYVLIDNNCKTFEEGKAFVVSIKDKFYIKRLFKNPLTGKIICKVDNPIMMNGTFEIDLKDIDIKAKLVNVLKKV